MEPITTWYKLQQNWDYRYSHFTQGHTTGEFKDKLYKNAYLDTSGKVNKVIEK